MDSLSPETDRNSDALKLGEITSPRFSAIETAPSVPAPPRAEELTERGRELIRAGDILAARLVLARAAEAGSALAALELGGTYDPVILGQVRRPQTAVTAVRANPPAEAPTSIELARVWYQRAKALGSIEAVERLNRLPTAERRK
jgi:hypothetical protein